MPSVSLLNDQFSHDFQYVLALTRYEFICMWKISPADSRLAITPQVTAGTSRVVKWTPRKLWTTPETWKSRCNPAVVLASILVFLRKVAHLRRRALKNASA